MQSITVYTKEGVPINLDWSVLERSLNTLLRLAPPELRSPAEFLDQVYEQKRVLADLFKKLDAAAEEGSHESALADSVRTVCMQCHASPLTCEFNPGTDGCVSRREEWDLKAV